jgi:osmotically inducible protein OsmC
MAVRKASARWEGDLQQGNGQVKTESGEVDGSYSFSSRFEEGSGTNPEELIGAAHAGCYSMALSNILSSNDYEPDYVHTNARVHLTKGDDGFVIPKIELEVEASVPGIENEAFQGFAEDAKNNCPVSKALGGVSDIALQAKLV